MRVPQSHRVTDGDSDTRAEDTSAASASGQLSTLEAGVWDCTRTVLGGRQGST